MTFRQSSATAGNHVPQRPFSHAEEAWFWFVHCQKARRLGCRLQAGGALFQRPCDPDDIYCALMRLHAQSVLSNAHLRTLATYGLRGSPPDTRCADEWAAARLWEEALDRLSTPLRAKGILV
jgi:hypothetical protein